MAFMANGLRDAFEGQGDAQFFAFSYACFDPLEEVLEPGYFPSGRLLKVGDLIFVGTRPRPAGNPWHPLKPKAEIRRALLMVSGLDARGRLTVRLVQDYGRPEDPSASIAATKRPRGRPKAGS